MAHTHHCEVCKIPVAICSDDGCVGPDAFGYYCTQHHPSPQFHRDLLPPPGRTTVIVTNGPKEDSGKK